MHATEEESRGARVGEYGPANCRAAQQNACRVATLAALARNATRDGMRRVRPGRMGLIELASP